MVVLLLRRERFGLAERLGQKALDGRLHEPGRLLEKVNFYQLLGHPFNKVAAGLPYVLQCRYNALLGVDN